MYTVIKRIAEAKNISIYRIEKELKLSNGSISKWNRSMPSADKLVKISILLGTNIEDIFHQYQKLQKGEVKHNE
ncbi:helix-turn-helix domain-containing protein [Holzapfeliella sp. JNUCC 80]